MVDFPEIFSLERRHFGGRAMPSKNAESLEFRDMHLVIGELTKT